MPNPLESEQAILNSVADGNRNFRVSTVQSDAANLRISTIIDNGSVSAKSGDAANLRVSAFSNDAGTLRMSAIGGATGDRVIVDGNDQTVSARIKQISAVLSASDNAFIVHTVSEGAHRNRTSAIQDGAGNLRVSAIQDGAAALNMSAKSDSAALFRSSAFQGDGANLRISAMQDSATNLNMSAKSDAANLFRVSSIQGDAVNHNVSAKSNDGGTLRTSAIIQFRTPTTAGLSQAQISATASGDNAIITGVASQTIRIWKLFWVATSAVDVTYRQGTTNLTPGMKFNAGGGQTLDFDGEPWFVTSAGQDFNMNLDSAVAVEGRIYYTQS